MHFWELTARLRRPMSEPGEAWPRKIGLNWFTPALVKSRVGSSSGTQGELGTNVWPPAAPPGLLLKNSMNVLRMVSAVRLWAKGGDYRGLELQPWAGRGGISAGITSVMGPCSVGNITTEASYDE